MNNDLFHNEKTTLTPCTFTVDQMIQVWVHEKANRTHSAETERAYASRLKEFRAVLLAAGLDLDSDPQLVAPAAQRWADHTDRVDEQGKPVAVAPSTFNQRLAILSSFYQTAIKRGALTANPIAIIARRPMEDITTVRAHDHTELRAQLAQIDRSTLIGLRDYALIAVFICTGRQCAEVNALRWSSLHFAGEEITLEFKRTRGAKTMSDTLPPGVARALMQCCRLSK